jgi:flagellar assembly factor FliW
MLIETTRFGWLRLREEDVLLFPTGLIGWEDCRQWVILADAENEAVGWLQSVTRPDLALAVVSPRRFVPDYRVRVVRRQLLPLQLESVAEAYVLVVVGKSETALTVNLKAPIVLNLERRLGRQVVTRDDQPMAHPAGALPRMLRKTA